jgi:hypothetical protein
MKYDDVTYLLIEIFQQANPLEPAPNAGKFVDLFRFEINELGGVLKFLGLAASDNCELGWVPSHVLMRIIAEQVASPSKKGSKSNVRNEDRDFVDSISQVVTGDPDADELSDFCCNILATFGLLEKCKDRGFKPTPRIKDIILNRLLKRAVVEAEAEEDERRRENNE